MGWQQTQWHVDLRVLRELAVVVLSGIDVVCTWGVLGVWGLSCCAALSPYQLLQCRRVSYRVIDCVGDCLCVCCVERRVVLAFEKGGGVCVVPHE
jgi:hypothetical protein